MKLATRICEVIGLLLLVFLGGFGHYIDSNRPTHPVGRFIYPSENHGQHIFVSQSDRLITVGAWVGFFVIVVVCIALEGLRPKDR